MVRADSVLDLRITSKEDKGRHVKVRGSLGCGDSEMMDPERREQGKEQNRSPGLQESRLQLIWIAAWKNPMGYSPDKKRAA